MNNRKRKNSSTWTWGTDLEPSQAKKDEYLEKHNRYLQYVEEYRKTHDGAEPPPPNMLYFPLENLDDENNVSKGKLTIKPYIENSEEKPQEGPTQDEYLAKHNEQPQWVEEYRRMHNGAEPPSMKLFPLLDLGDENSPEPTMKPDIQREDKAALTQEKLPANFMQDLSPKAQECDEDVLTKLPKQQGTNDETERVYCDFENKQQKIQYDMFEQRRLSREIARRVIQDLPQEQNDNEVIDNELEFNEAYSVLSSNWAGRPK